MTELVALGLPVDCLGYLTWKSDTDSPTTNGFQMLHNLAPFSTYAHKVWRRTCAPKDRHM